MANVKKALAILLLGALGAVCGHFAWQFYGDYQDFKQMREMLSHARPVAAPTTPPEGAK